MISLVVSLALTRRLPILPLVSGIVVLVFGGLALWLHDETFIKMKPTIINALFGAVYSAGRLRQAAPGYVFVGLRPTDQAWPKLTLRWSFLLLPAPRPRPRWCWSLTDLRVTFKAFGLPA